MARPTTYPRTTYEARMDVAYSARVQQLHSRLFGQLRWGIGAINLASAMVAFSPIFGAKGIFGAIGGAIIATVTVIDVLSGLPERVAAHTLQRGRYLDLLAATSDQSPLSDVDSVLYSLSKSDPSEIQALANPAFNDNLCTHGREDYCVPLTSLERFFAALA